LPIQRSLFCCLCFRQGAGKSEDRVSSLVLSHVQAAPLLALRRAGAAEATLSPDLGLTIVRVTLDADTVRLPDETGLLWRWLEAIAASEASCFAIQNGQIEQIQRYSEETGRFCSLMPTSGAPTLMLAAFPMHRIKGTDPQRDTLSKIKAVAPIAGRVLDTTTGLGYTAIEACRSADEVITLELDPAVLEIARMNPWSRALYESPNITQLVGDSGEIVGSEKEVVVGIN
jgi:uncharacterized protein